MDPGYFVHMEWKEFDYGLIIWAKVIENTVEVGRGSVIFKNFIIRPLCLLAAFTITENLKTVILTI